MLSIRPRLSQLRGTITPLWRGPVPVAADDTADASPVSMQKNKGQPLSAGVAAATVATTMGLGSLTMAEAAPAATAATAATTATATGPLATFLSIAPPACFGFLQVSGLKTCREIEQKGTVGDLSPLQFVSLAVNCSVWVMYGLLRWDMTVLLPNFTGLLFGLYYTNVYRQYTPVSISKYLLGGAAITTAAAGMALTMPAASAATSIGLMGCTLAVILMSSPLATMKTVIATKNTSAMPFATSLATFLNAATWAGYGVLVAGDPLIWAPNLMGLAAASVQMSLFAKYGIHTAPPEEDAESDTANKAV